MAEPGIDPPSLSLAARIERATVSAVILVAGRATGATTILVPSGPPSLVTPSAIPTSTPPRSLADPTSA